MRRSSKSQVRVLLTHEVLTEASEIAVNTGVTLSVYMETAVKAFNASNAHRSGEADDQNQ